MVKDGKKLTNKSLWSKKPLVEKKTQNKRLVIPQKITECRLLPFHLAQNGKLAFAKRNYILDDD
jgi:hypothetical protein